jgi:hypothetical protein
MPAAVETTGTTAEAAANLPARNRTAISISAVVIVAIARMRQRARTIPSTCIEVRAIETRSIVAVVPRAGANKDTTHEPRRTVITVRRACIGIIPIVAIRTYGGRTDISRTNPNPNRNPRVRRNHGQHQETQQNEMS